MDNSSAQVVYAETINLRAWEVGYGNSDANGIIPK